MAISLVSPGIKITEKDLVSTLPSSGATVGGFAGQFRWGPIEEATLVTSTQSPSYVAFQPHSYDAFSRFRVSETNGLFDCTFPIDKQPLLFSELTTSSAAQHLSMPHSAAIQPVTVVVEWLAGKAAQY